MLNRGGSFLLPAAFMHRLRPFLLALVLSAAMPLAAQMTSPTNLPIPEDSTPQPFPYPDGLAEANFDLPLKPAGTVILGEDEVELGKTRLSEITRKTRASLHHSESREDYLCFSAPIKSTPDESGPERYQNMWFVLGDRGQIREARMELINVGDPICRPFTLDNHMPLLGGLTVGTEEKDIMRALPVSPISEDRENGWKYWFSQQPDSEDANGIELNLFGVQIKDGRIHRMISIVETVKNQ